MRTVRTLINQKVVGGLKTAHAKVVAKAQLNITQSAGFMSQTAVHSI